MKTVVIQSLKAILADRLVTALIILFVLACIGYCIYVGISLHPSDLQVAVHYTAYGETNFYRDKWYYLISFIGLGALVAVIHTTLVTKLYLQGRRSIALLFLALSFLLIIIAWIIAFSIIKIAFL